MASLRMSKESGKRRLSSFESDYVFLRYAGPDELMSYDRLDFGLFGRSWCPIVSWAVGFVPQGKEDTYRNYLPPANSNIMGGAAFDVVASDSSHGILLATDGSGSHQRALHAIRTIVPFDKLKGDCSIATSGGSLVLQINLLDDENKTGDVVDCYSFDGHMYWSLYFNKYNKKSQWWPW